jgi:hypothetical protein
MKIQAGLLAPVLAAAVAAHAPFTQAQEAKYVRSKVKLNNQAGFVAHTHNVCFLNGPMPPEFAQLEIGEIYTIRKGYGSVDLLYLPMANEARRYGADAIVEFHGDHRGSMNVLRMSMPTGQGKLVKLTDEAQAFDCKVLGGFEN